MNSLELREKMAALVDEAKAISERAKADDRDLTDEEARDCDSKLDEAETLGQDATAAESREKRQVRIDDAAGSLDAPVQEQQVHRADPQANAEPKFTAPNRRDLRAFKGADGERAAHLSGMWLRAIRGDERARDWCRLNGVEYRVATEAVNTGGGYLVPAPLSDTIISLQDEWGVARRECERIDMTSDSLSVPKQPSNSGVTASWTGEAATITASDITWNAITLQAKKLATISRVSSELMDDAIVSLADWIATDAALRLAEAEDDALINGDGTSTYGGIFGIKGRFDSNEALAGVYTAAAGNDTYAELTVGDLAGMISVLAPYAYNGTGPSLFASNVGRALVFERLGQAGGGTSVLTIANGLVSAYSGWPVVISNKLSTSTGDLSENAMILFGNLRQACLFGDRRAVTVQVLNELYAASDEVGIRVTERVDINFHDFGDTTNAGAVTCVMGD